MRKATKEVGGSFRFSERKRARTVTVEVDVGGGERKRVCLFQWEDIILPRGKRHLEVYEVSLSDDSLRLLLRKDIDPGTPDRMVDEEAKKAIRHRLEGGRR